MNKKNYILGAILILLIGLAYLYQGPVKKWQINSSKPKNFLAKIETDKLDKIVIKNTFGEITLEKKDNDWLVKNNQTEQKDFPASASLIDGLLGNLKKSQDAGLELASANKDRKSEFQTDDKGIVLKLYSTNKEVANLTVGKLTSDYLSTYLRQTDSDNTYKMVGINLFTDLAGKEWRNTKIFSTDKTVINKIRFQYLDNQFTIQKKNNDWLADKTKLKADKVDKLTQIFSNLNAIEIPKQDFGPTGLDKSQLIIQASGNALDNTLMIGKDNGKNMYYVKRSDNDYIYLISKEDRDELSKKIDQLK